MLALTVLYLLNHGHSV